MRNSFILAVFIVITGLCSFAIGQENSTSFEASGEGILFMDIPVNIATKIDTPLRETPGIVSVVTREEIENSGARDLQEVLALFVPGYGFVSEQEGAVLPAFRGISIMEAKVLFMVDGMQLNERIWGSAVSVAGHYPIDTIEKIEVIRGPGSAIYGEAAELSVVNIITRKPTKSGNYVSFNNSQMSRTFSHRGLGTGFGKVSGELLLNANAAVSFGSRSQRDIEDYYGDTASRLANSDVNTANINVAMDYKDYSMRVYINQLRTTQIDLWGVNYTNGAVKENWDTYIAELKYNYKVTPSLSLTPRIEYKVDFPWIANVEDQQYTNNKRAERKLINLTGNWVISNKTNVLSGIEASRSGVYLPDNPGPYEETFKNGTNKIENDTFSGFAQLIANTDLFNLTLGSRYDTGDLGKAFVPRIALTKVVDEFHYKLSAGQSFRSPIGIQPNRTLPDSSKLVPEIATTYEAECGYLIGTSMWLVVNGFDITINDPIIYGADPITGIGNFRNYGKVGTRGLESEYCYRGRNIDFTMNYAYYFATFNEIQTSAVPADSKLLIGNPAHKINAIADIRINPNFSVHPSVSYSSEKYAYLRYDSVLQDDILSRIEPVTEANINARARNVLFKDTEVDIGVRNIFDQRIDIAPGYKSYMNSIPALSRSYVVKFTYTF